MAESNVTSASCYSYELHINISATRERVWKAIFEETNHWWLEDFHVAGPDSNVTFDAIPGGRGLFELAPDGSALQWYAVQMFLPVAFKVYLVGNVAPEWGGPTTSNLKLALDEVDGGCVLQVCDARHGFVDEEKTKSYEDGWRQLFTDGLKKYVETGAV